MKRIMKKETLRNGNFQHLAEIIDGQNGDFPQFKEFEDSFYRYHSHVILSTMKWTQNPEKPLLKIEVLGVYDNLNLMSKRIIKILEDYFGEKEIHEIDTEYKLDELTLTIFDDFGDFSIICHFVSFNQANNEDNLNPEWLIDIPL